MNIPIKLTVATAAALFLQSTPPLSDVVSPIQNLGTQGLEGVAIYFLWRALAKKDEDAARKEAAKDAAIEAKDAALARKDAEYTTMAIKVTETMALVMEAMKESRKATEGMMALVMESVKESRKATEEIGAALDNFASNLAALPCTLDALRAERAEQKDALRRIGK